MRASPLTSAVTQAANLIKFTLLVMSVLHNLARIPIFFPPSDKRWCRHVPTLRPVRAPQTSPSLSENVRCAEQKKKRLHLTVAAHRHIIIYSLAVTHARERASAEEAGRGSLLFTSVGFDSFNHSNSPNSHFLFYQKWN